MKSAVARKTYLCDSCEEFILPGQRYVRTLTDTTRDHPDAFTQYGRVVRHVKRHAGCRAFRWRPVAEAVVRGLIAMFR